ncbi:hypothetical protein RJI07_04665 [Mycoplasmatota bacterium WC30]
MKHKNKEILKQEYTFYRMKYNRLSTFYTIAFLLFVIILVNIVVFGYVSLITTVFIILIYGYPTFIKLPKYLFSIIQFSSSGMIWFYKGTIIANFEWESIVDIKKGSFGMTATFDLVLDDIKVKDLRVKAFPINCDKEILTAMIECCTNQTLIEKLKEFHLKY